jgi:hypothetical protein
MVNKMKRVVYLLIAAALVGLGLFPAQALAASANLYLSPASGSVSNGSTITVSVRENSGNTQVNAAQANLSYPTSLFDVTSVTSSSAFNIVAENSYGNGSIRIGRGASPAVTGDQLVATIRFKAKTSSGSASVSFTAGSAITANDGNGTNILSGSSGGVYTLTPVPPAPPAAAKDTTPPAISAVKVSSTSINNAVIEWITSEPATSEVDYGLNTGYGLVTVDNSLVTNHKLTLSSPIITPATMYHFVVKSVDAAGNTAAGSDSSFRTKGATLNVLVIDQHKKPVKGAVIAFGNASATTDKAGKATLINLPIGQQSGTVTYHGAKTLESVDILSADPAKPQSATFQIKARSINTIIFIIPLILVALGALAYLWKRRANMPQPPLPLSDNSGPVILPQAPTTQGEPSTNNGSLPPEV